MEISKSDDKYLSTAERSLDYRDEAYLVMEDGEIEMIKPNNIAKINDSISKKTSFDNLIFRK